jgi:hypothetical protein
MKKATYIYIGSVLLAGALTLAVLMHRETTPVVPDANSLTFSNTQTWNEKLLPLTIQRPNIVPDVYARVTLTKPPLNDSETTSAELAQLHQLISERKAGHEEIVQEMDLDTTYFGTYTFADVTNASTHPATRELLHTTLKELDPVLFYYKNAFDRVRPHKLDTGLTTDIEVPGHPAYPSGHATQSYFIARILSELDPERGDAYIESAYRIAHNREIAGLHYPSDSEAGRSLAQQYLVLLKETAWYKEQFEKAAKEWRE